MTDDDHAAAKRLIEVLTAFDQEIDGVEIPDAQGKGRWRVASNGIFEAAVQYWIEKERRLMDRVDEEARQDEAAREALER